eukprot:281121_1
MSLCFTVFIACIFSLSTVISTETQFKHSRPLYVSMYPNYFEVSTHKNWKQIFQSQCQFSLDNMFNLIPQNSNGFWSSIKLTNGTLSNKQIALLSQINDVISQGIELLELSGIRDIMTANSNDLQSTIDVIILMLGSKTVIKVNAFVNNNHSSNVSESILHEEKIKQLIKFLQINDFQQPFTQFFLSNAPHVKMEHLYLIRASIEDSGDEDTWYTLKEAPDYNTAITTFNQYLLIDHNLKQTEELLMEQNITFDLLSVFPSICFATIFDDNDEDFLFIAEDYGWKQIVILIDAAINKIGIQQVRNTFQEQVTFVNDELKFLFKRGLKILMGHFTDLLCDEEQLLSIKRKLEAVTDMLIAMSISKQILDIIPCKFFESEDILPCQWDVIRTAIVAFGERRVKLYLNTVLLLPNLNEMIIALDIATKKSDIINELELNKNISKEVIFSVSLKQITIEFNWDKYSKIFLSLNKTQKLFVTNIMRCSQSLEYGFKLILENMGIFGMGMAADESATLYNVDDMRNLLSKYHTTKRIAHMLPRKYFQSNDIFLQNNNWLKWNELTPKII